jgi:hypothetical protein
LEIFWGGDEQLRRDLVDIDHFRRSKILAQGRLVNLAGGIARQGIDEFDQLRALEASQIRFAA